VPAKAVGEVSEEYKKLWTSYKNLYVKLALRYPKTLEMVQRNQAQLTTFAPKRR
jgi:hypothetical protein